MERFAFLRRFTRNRGALIGALLILLVTVTALAAPLLFPTDPLRMVGPPELWPGEDPAFPLGTDSLGRDMLAMLVHGARATLLIGLFASAMATLIGVSVGAIAGYFGGWIDEAAMRAVELFQTIPNLIFVLTIVVILGSTLHNIVIAIGIVSWTPIARMTRAEFLALRDREFVQACRSMGMHAPGIIVREILPNALPPVIVLSSLVVASAILFESAVSFLGLGDPNVASWGRLVGDGRQLIRSSWYICAIPGIAIMVTVLCLNLIGDGLNDALNPKLRDR
ncbi:peptide/nickel transport system permease protein [Enhydrobacter aerosaccus]|uniref:Peptide/nickel transport system permease protein n=1 Tax=Enhydrobacter aerosaccus TaxID=225324 RepID=A0A1T4QDL7_9HYPH|nr:ABC transporter permease [Enhydrobacter aerosaccus]SKA01893.1 peptide/nickel transport system permease protein [Enhydrobacter aerosaccus]